MLITNELQRRPGRKNFAAENRALSVLARELAEAPDRVLSRLTELVLQVCQADSAGISLLEPGPPEIFRWTAVAGAFADNLGDSIPRHESPCGVVIERNQVLLFRDGELHFPRLRAVKPVIYESLLAPFELDGRPGGTVWAVKHRPGAQFNAEDARLLESLSSFAAVAYRATQARARAERARDSVVAMHPRLLQVSKMATIGEIASGIANELSQPLTAIGNYAQACKRLLEHPQTQRETLGTALDEITAEAHRAAETISSLRRLVANPVSDAPESDLNEAVKEALEMLQVDARMRKVRIEARLSTRPVPVKIQRTQIQHVVLNLVHNALQVLESTASTREVIVETRPGLEGVDLMVSDNGPGLPEDALQRMFDPFFSTKASGTGLGLAVSHSIIRAHGGRLSYERNATGGASFRIRLPGSSRS